MKKILGLIVLLCLLLPVAALAASYASPAPSPQALIEITLNLSPTSLNLTVGESRLLTVTASLPLVGYLLQWETNNSGVATVANGLVRCVGAGTATITAKLLNVLNLVVAEATCLVTGVAGTVLPVAVTGVSVSPTSLNLLIGDAQVLSTTVSPANATDQTVMWTTGNSAVATVSGSGVVRAVGAGSATITATTRDGGHTAICSVTVGSGTTAVPVAGISLSSGSLSLNAGESRLLTITVSPSDATNQAITWTSSNSAVAMVSNGLVSAVGAGSATITATAQDGGFTAICSVTVSSGSGGTTVPVTGVSLTQTSLNLTVGHSLQLSAAVSPANATNQSLTWSTGSSAVATVSNGLVTAVGAGSTVITVTTQNGGFTATCGVTVGTGIPNAVSVTGVGVTPASLSLNLGSSRVLTGTVSPSNATNQTLGWSTSNSNVATVVGGVVTAVGAGSATITVMTQDGGFRATCGVTVSAGSGGTTVPVSGISFVVSSLNISVKQTVYLAVTISPSNATNQAFTWSTSNANVATVVNGLVTGVGAGSAVIAATTQDGGFKAVCNVNVTVAATTVPVSGISVTPTSMKLTVGDAKALTAAITPANATNKGVIWSTNNVNVASVDNAGSVTGIAAGTAIIKATAMDGGFQSTCNVEVTSQSSGGGGGGGGCNVSWFTLSLLAVVPLMLRGRR